MVFLFSSNLLHLKLAFPHRANLIKILSSRHYAHRFHLLQGASPKSEQISI